MAALSTNNIVNAGTAPTFVAAAASDTADVGTGGNTFVVYRNSDTNTKTVTVVVPGETEYGVATPDPTFEVAQDAEVWIPLRRAYKDDTGRATLNVTGTGGVTGVTVAVVRMA